MGPSSDCDMAARKLFQSPASVAYLANLTYESPQSNMVITAAQVKEERERERKDCYAICHAE